MAITWDIKITVLDVARKDTSIVATRTDNTDPLNIKSEIHTIINTVLATAAQKIAALELIWSQHLSWQNKQAQISAIVGDLEQQAKVNLEAREV